MADAIKTMFKEDVAPEDSDRLLYNLAPVLMAVPLLVVFALIPVGIGTFVVDLNVGILFILAITHDERPGDRDGRLGVRQTVVHIRRPAGLCVAD